MADVDAPESQIGFDQRSQHFQVGIVLKIRQLHAVRIVRTRTKIQEGETGGLVVLLLAERARSECARSTRALEDQPGCPLKRKTSKLGGDGEEWPGALLARRTRTIRMCSFDARSKGQPGLLPLADVWSGGSTAAVKSSSRPCLLGIELEKRVRMDARSGRSIRPHSWREASEHGRTISISNDAEP